MDMTFKQGRRVVLLAEDDLEMRLLLSSVFKQDGWTVIECRDGLQFLAKLGPSLKQQQGWDCDLIVSDIRMPGITGMEMMATLTGYPKHPPVIMITAFGDTEIHEKARQLGAAATLDKPFDIEDFKKTVYKVIES